MTSSPIVSRIAELTGPGQLVFREESLDPDRLPPGHLLARTLCSAISVGTELAAWMGLPPLRPGRTYPRLVGYCNVATVVALGPGSGSCQIGDRILTHQSHRSAFTCPESDILLRLAPTADAVVSSTTYLFQLGYNALIKGGFSPGYHVAVVGLGVVGLGAAALAHAFGGRVGVFSDQPACRALAGRLGAPFAAQRSDPTAPRKFWEWTGGLGADLVITTSNGWDDWKLALQLARREGTVGVLGFPGRGQPPPDFNPLDSSYLYDKQLRIVACGMSPDGDPPPHEVRFTVKRNCEFLHGCILNGRLPAAKLVGSSRPWNELPQVYGKLSRRMPGELIPVLTWENAG